MVFCLKRKSNYYCTTSCLITKRPNKIHRFKRLEKNFIETFLCAWIWILIEFIKATEHKQTNKQTKRKEKREWRKTNDQQAQSRTDQSENISIVRICLLFPFFFDHFRTIEAMTEKQTKAFWKSTSSFSSSFSSIWKDKQKRKKKAIWREYSLAFRSENALKFGRRTSFLSFLFFLQSGYGKRKCTW